MSHQPAGRPVIGMTLRPAASRRSSAVYAAAGQPTMRGQGVVDVGEDIPDAAAFSGGKRG